MGWAWEKRAAGRPATNHSLSNLWLRSETMSQVIVVMMWWSERKAARPATSW